MKFLEGFKNVDLTKINEWLFNLFYVYNVIVMEIEDKQISTKFNIISPYPTYVSNFLLPFWG